MVKDLLGWLIEKADARSMQRLLLRLSLLVIVLLALSSEFPLMVDAARLPFSYVELRHDTFEINAERRLYQISVQNLGTVKADTVRIRVRTAGGKPTIREVSTSEEFKILKLTDAVVVEVKRLPSLGSISLSAQIPKFKGSQNVEVQVSSDQGVSKLTSTPTKAQLISSYGAAVRSVLVDGFELLRTKFFSRAAERRIRMHERAVLEIEELRPKIEELRIEPRSAVTLVPIEAKRFDIVENATSPSQSLDSYKAPWLTVMISREFVSSLFFSLVITLLAGWIVSGTAAYILMAVLLPAMVFAYFPDSGFRPEYFSGLGVAGLCVLPAAMAWTSKDEYKPLASKDWEAAVGLDLPRFHGHI